MAVGPGRRCQFGLLSRLVEELQCCGHRPMPPQRERVLDSGGHLHLAGQRRGKGTELGALLPEQFPRITPGAVV